MNITSINYNGQRIEVPACKKTAAHTFRFSPASGTFAARYTCAGCGTMLKAEYVASE